MGSVEITVPPDTIVDLEVTPVMASVEEHGERVSTIDPPHLYLNGTVVMASVEIHRRA